MPTVMINQIQKNVQNIYCVARNYTEHVLELNNEVPDEPPIFLKPNSSLLLDGGLIQLPSFSQDIHYECELIIYINQAANYIAPEEAMNVVGAYGVGLDLTARDIQNQLKDKGLPWLKAKGFRHAACVSNFIEAKALPDHENINFTLSINDELKQSGNTSHMINSIPKLISIISDIYGLQDGDLIFTGTPKGIGPLHSKDKLKLTLENLITSEFSVI